MLADPYGAETAIQVLVVDDSPLMQRIITRLLESDSGIHVIDTASDGVEAVQKVAVRHPDVVTLDIEMPNLNGLGALKLIMEQTPTPVIMLSAMDEADTVMRALQLGAIDFVSKPSGTVSIDLYKVRDEIIHKIKLATFARPKPSAEVAVPLILDSDLKGGARLPHAGGEREGIGQLSEPWIIAVGASTGGPKAIGELMSALPRGLPISVCIVQHMPVGFTKSFAERLDRASQLSVVEAEHGMVMELGCAYVAAGGVHMVLARRGEQVVVQLEQTPPVHSVRPSIDVLMRSAAKVGGARTIGVLLTGMGSDGAEGLAAIKLAGGTTLVQDRETSTIFGMPKAAIGRGVVDQILPLMEIPGALVTAVRRHSGGRQTPGVVDGDGERSRGAE